MVIGITTWLLFDFLFYLYIEQLTSTSDEEQSNEDQSNEDQSDEQQNEEKWSENISFTLNIPLCKILGGSRFQFFCGILHFIHTMAQALLSTSSDDTRICQRTLTNVEQLHLLSTDLN